MENFGLEICRISRSERRKISRSWTHHLVYAVGLGAATIYSIFHPDAGVAGMPLMLGIMTHSKRSGMDGAKYFTSHAKQAEYYSGEEKSDGKEPAGIWFDPNNSLPGTNHGQQVDAKTFYALWEGFNPQTGEELIDNAGKNKNRINAYDYCFSPVKSFSALWAIAPPDMRMVMEDIQREAVEAAIEEARKLELGRRGHNGETKERVELIAAIFEHGSSRMGQPQIHSHCLFLNVARRPDGTYGAIDERSMLQNQAVMASAYHVTLAERSRERLGLKMRVPPGEAIAKVIGVPEDICDEWSKESKKIKEARGTESSTDVNRAYDSFLAKAVRAEKHEILLTREEFHERWTKEGAAKGWTLEKFMGVLNQEKNRPLTEQEKREIAKAAIDQLLAGTSVFKLPQLTSRIARFTQDMGTWRETKEIAEIAKREYLRELGMGKDGMPVYSTEERIKLEREMIEMSLQQDSGHVLDANLVEQIITEKKGMTQEQAEAVRYACIDAGRTSCLEGSPGVGKSYSLEAIQKAYLASGYSIHGVALSWSASDVLSEEARIEHTRAIEGFVRDLEKGKIKLDAKSLVIIDEAGLVGSVHMHKIQAAVAKAGGKLLPTGDAKQIAPVAGGSAFQSMILARAQRDGKGSRIRTIRRQYLDFSGTAAKAELAAEKIHEEIIKSGPPTQNMKDFVLELGARGHVAPEGALNSFAACRRFLDQHSYFVGQDEKHKMKSAQPITYSIGEKAVIERDENGHSTKIGTITKVDGEQITITLDDGTEKLVRATRSSHWQREAVAEIFDGNAHRAVARHYAAGGLKLCDTKEDAIQAMLHRWGEWREANPGKIQLLLAADNKSVSELNHGARQILRARGEIGEDIVALPTTDLRKAAAQPSYFAVGDFVMFRKNVRELGLFNRTTGKIEAIEIKNGAPEITVRLDRGGTCTVRCAPDGYWDKSTGACPLQYGYGTTFVSSQGMTRSSTLKLGSEREDSRSSGVNMSRHKESVETFVAKDEIAMRIAGDTGEWRSPAEIPDKEYLKAISETWGRPSEKMTTWEWIREHEQAQAAHQTRIDASIAHLVPTKQQTQTEQAIAAEQTIFETRDLAELPEIKLDPVKIVALKEKIADRQLDKLDLPELLRDIKLDVREAGGAAQVTGDNQAVLIRDDKTRRWGIFGWDGAHQAVGHRIGGVVVAVQRYAKANRAAIVAKLRTWAKQQRQKRQFALQTTTDREILARNREALRQDMGLSTKALDGSLPSAKRGLSDHMAQTKEGAAIVYLDSGGRQKGATVFVNDKNSAIRTYDVPGTDTSISAILPSENPQSKEVHIVPDAEHAIALAEITAADGHERPEIVIQRGTVLHSAARVRTAHAEKVVIHAEQGDDPWAERMRQTVAEQGKQPEVRRDPEHKSILHRHVAEKVAERQEHQRQAQQRQKEQGLDR